MYANKPESETEGWQVDVSEVAPGQETSMPQGSGFKLYASNPDPRAGGWQVDVSEVVVGPDPNAVYMVMEHMDHELKALMDAMPRPFSTAEVCTVPERGQPCS